MTPFYRMLLTDVQTVTLSLEGSKQSFSLIPVNMHIFVIKFHEIHGIPFISNL